MTYRDAATKEFMQSLFEDEAARSFAEIAKLPMEERRAAMANPRSFLERAGLHPPKDVTLRMREAQGADFEGLGSLDDGDGTGRPFPRLERQDIRLEWCIDICWGGSDKERVRETLLRCVHICF
ncbi:MAG TPA: hypothetical protein VES64_05925 [Allosphingosinicella sp.]|nr:hypothetical protein [Allosphingosinicella sp.]